MQGAGRVRQHRGMTNRNRPIGTGGRSSIDRLPAKLREAVDRAIADGATIDEITARIRAEGGACSRSAVGRRVKKVRDLIRKQQESDRAIESWARTLGERAEDHTGRLAIQCLRTLVLHATADLRERAETEPVTVDEVARLALALGRIESADKLRAQREQAANQAAIARAHATREPGLSDEAVALIRRAIEGDPEEYEIPRSPAESNGADAHPTESHFIPANPTKN